MGWTSTGDPYANVSEAGLTFDSAKSAKEFAEKHGWSYVVGPLFFSQELTIGWTNRYSICDCHWLDCGKW
jgi:hypothetical protein